MIVNNRHISKEEQFALKLDELAKSLGGNYIIEEWAPVGYEDYMPPYSLKMNLTLNGVTIGEIIWGRWQVDGFRCVLSKYAFGMKIYHYCAPYKEFKNFVWKIKNFFKKKKAPPYTYKEYTEYFFYPDCWDIEQKDIDYLKAQNFKSPDEIKELIKYLYTENEVNIKKRKMYIRQQDIMGDF